MTIQQDILTISAAFAKLDRMDPCGPVYGDLCDLLDSCDDEALKFAYESNIKFVSRLAWNRLLRRGLIERVSA